MSCAYSAALSRTACPPSASSWLTSPCGPSFRSALATANSLISLRQMLRIMSADMSMSRPKYVA